MISTELLLRKKYPKAGEFEPSVISLMSIGTREENVSRKPSRGRLSASQMTRCRRKQQYSLILAPEVEAKIPLKLLRIFATGHYSETRFSNHLERGAEARGNKWQPKVKVAYPELMIGGELDGILTDPHGVPWIVDFKTINADRFEKLTGIGLDYQWQFQVYMFVTGIHQTICFYEQKNSSEPKEYILRFDEEVFQQIYKEVIRPILRLTAKGELVPPDLNICVKDGCPYKEICYSELPFSDVDGRSDNFRKKFPTKVPKQLDL